MEGPSIADAQVMMQSVSFVPLTLQGHEDILWKEHISFTDAKSKFKQGPKVGESHALSEYVKIDNTLLLQCFRDVLTPIASGILGIVEIDIADENEQGVDKDVLETLLELFIDFPPQIYKEVCIEAKTQTKVVGGRIDLVAGSSSNGNRPQLEIVGLAVYLGTLVEAKEITEDLVQARPKELTTDIKAILQPMLGTMAIAQKCAFPHRQVPLVNIFASRHYFRPFLYFKDHDVMLTSLGVVPLRSKHCIYMVGLQLLHFMFHLHEHPFEAGKLATLPKTGWTKDMPRYAYGPESKVTLQAVNAHVAHSGITEPLTQTRKRVTEATSSKKLEATKSSKYTNR